MLTESGWSYIDTTGNAYLSMDRPGLFISSDGATRDPSPKQSAGPNLRGPRAWALQRTLVEMLPTYGVSELSAALGIDAGYVSRLLGALSEELRDLSSSKLKGWAVTGSFAASRRVSVTAPEIAVVFTEDPERLAGAMRLRPVRNGGNVVTALPYDRIVFERTWQEDNIVYASLAQTVMDCMTGFGRMPAEADALLDWMRRRAPRWQAPSLTVAAVAP